MSKRWNITVVSLALMVVLLLTGCGTVDVVKVRERIDAFEKSVPVLEAAAKQLQAMAEETGNEAHIAAAANTKAALDFTVEQIPKMKSELARLEAQAPIWKVALAAAWPLILAGLRFVPVVGGALAPVATAAWAMYATKKQKAEEVA